MSARVIEDTARYDTTAADIYATFHAKPTSPAVADDFHAMQAVAD